MGEVIVSFKIMPESIETDLEKLEEKIKKEILPQKIEKEPIAFGLFALKVTKLIPEESGELEKVENRIKSLEGVGEVEIVEISRSL
ncbi:MAG: elongation factor 1-beta [Candidatus Bathyarchaeia archaeon]